MKKLAKVRNGASSLVRRDSLRLERLEDRLPPGSLLGMELPEAPPLAPTEPGTTLSVLRVKPSAGSPREFRGLADWLPEATSPVASTASSTVPWGNPLRAEENLWGVAPRPVQAERLVPLSQGTESRPGPAGGSGAFRWETPRVHPGSFSWLPLASPQEGQTIALTVLAQALSGQELPGQAPPIGRDSDGGGDGPGVTGEFGVVWVYPGSNTQALPADTPLVIEFTEPVDPASLNSSTFAVFGRASGMTPGYFDLFEDGRIVQFTPERSFMPGEAVEVMLTHDLASIDGSTLRAAGYAWTFWVQVGGGNAAFYEADRLDTGTGVRTYGGAATDLNFDGWVDIAVVNEVSADMRVFMSNGDGTFGSYTTYANRPGSSPTVAADFNRDGLTDIASSNYDDNSMSIFLGNGDGTFQSSVWYRAGSVPSGIAALDLNGDGALEIVIANAGSNNLSLFWNNSDGTFQPHVQFFNVPGARLYGLAAADMNNDGLMDLIVGAQQSRRVYVLTNDGAGDFFLTADQNAGGGPWVLRAADVNGDGYADVEIANNGQGNMGILFGDGLGSLSDPTTYSAGSSPVSVSLGDLNGDGSLDVVISNFSSRDYAIFLNDGAGQFTRSGTLRARQSGSCAILLDVNGDGALDIGGVDELEDEIILFMNNG